MNDHSDPFVQLSAGEAVFKEGDVGSDMFIIESGTIDILKKSHGNEPLATLEAGDFFGEMAVLEDQPRFASAIARSSCRLLRIDRAAFGDVLAQNIEIAIRIMRKLTARLRRSELRITELSLASKQSIIEAKNATDASQSNVRNQNQEQWCLHHVGAAKSFILSGAKEFLIGRPDPVTGINPAINLGPLDLTRSLSRRHAKISLDGQTPILSEDVGTTNGTFLNGVRLKTGEPVSLKVGDRIRFGSIEVEVLKQTSP
jgi:hypothetical protein